MKKLFSFLLMAMLSMVVMAEKEIYGVFDDGTKTLTIYYDEDRESKSGVVEWWKDITIPGATEVVEFAASVADARPTSTRNWFEEFTKLTTINGLENLNTEEVTNMNSMFFNCGSLTSLDLSSFHTEKVENMGYLFYSCSKLSSLDISGFNTGNVWNMYCMFAYCSKLNFSKDFFLYFDTRKVENMGSMFADCKAATELDLCNFNMEKVESAHYMFEDCSNLETIVCSGDWSALENLTESDDMFAGCDKLVGGWGTMFDGAEPTDKTYAHPDRGGSNPGYFTDAPSELYTEYDEETKVLTYYFDELRNTRKGVTDLVEYNKRNFAQYYDQAEKVVIEPLVSMSGISELLYFFRGNVNGVPKGLEKVKKIEGLNHIPTGAVTNMASMFFGMHSIDSLDLSSFNVENVTNMSYMFYGCVSLKYVNLSSFDKTGNVEYFDRMFANCINLESVDVRMFDTHSATTMEHMFDACHSLKSLDLSYFNTDNVEKMSYMFQNCTSLETLALDRFTTYSLVDAGGMFGGSGKLQTIWCPADFSGVTKNTNMFWGCESLVGSKNTAFDEGHVDGDYAHPDGGSGYEGYFSERGTDKLMYTVFDPTTHILTYYYDNMFYDRPYNTAFSIPDLLEDKVLFRTYCDDILTIDINASFADARPTKGGELFHQFILDEKGGLLQLYSPYYMTSLSGWENVNTSEMTDMSYMFTDLRIDLKALDFSSFNTGKVTTMREMFSNADNTTALDLSQFNTENVTDMSWMFYNCSSLTSLDLSTFDTKNVTDMSNMFSGCSGLTSLDVTGFNTSKVTYMSDMFASCSGLTSLDVSKMDTKNVESMSGMFAWNYGLTSLDVSKLNTEMVRDMSYMFSGCSGIDKLDLSSFRTDSVRFMLNMFAYSSGLTELDLSSFHTDSVVDMSGMFQECSGLTELDLSSFHTDSVVNMSGMFQECSGLTKLDLSNFNVSKVTVMNQMFSGCLELTELNISSFRPLRLEYAADMFYACEKLKELDLSQFKAPNLKEAYSMFEQCLALERLDLSAFESKDIRDLNSMFAECAELKYVDISSFGRHNLYSVYGVFENCAKLDTIVCNDNWKLTKTLVDEYYSSARIFAGCDVLRGPLGSTTADYAVDLADDYVHINYAHVDEGVSKPGFFTPKFKVLFVDADESELKTEYVVYGHAATEPAKPTKEGYHFVEWDQDFDAVKDNLTIKPVFEINTYKVEFVVEHGAITSDPEITDYEHVEHGSEFVLTATPADGYELDSWTNYDGVKLVVTSDTTVTATFKLKEYKVTFVAEHGTITSDPEIADMDHVKHGSEFVLTATPDEGYVLNEWINYDESKLYVTSDTTVTATFKLQTFDVKFLDINGDQIGATQVVEWGHDAVAPEAPEVEGYTFQGWNASFVNVKANITVEAIYAINEYKVTFVAEHGSIASDPVVADLNKVEHGTELVLTATPDEGYDFDEWTNYNGMKLVVTSDTTVTAAFKLKTFTVIFEDWDGTQIGESQIVEWGSAATAPEEPTREGWTFAGWNKAFNVVKEDLTVTATYTKNPVYTVTFIDYDESVIAEVKVEEGKDAVAPDDPIREGYHFTGWDKAFNNVTEDLTVTAQYAINTYTVTFLGFEDVKLGEQVVEHGQDAPGVMAPVVDGYVFKGWDTDYTKVTKDLTVKAIYEKDLTPKNLKVNLEDKDGDVLITLTWDKVDGVPTYDVQVFDGEDELVTTNTFGQNVVELKLSELVKKYSIKPGTYTLDWAVRSTDALLKPLSEWAEGPEFEITVKSPGPGTGVDEVQSDKVQSTKVLREGHIYIIVGDKTFDASGRLVK